MTERLSEICTKDTVFINEPMAKHTTFKTGGNADYFVLPKTKEQLISVLKLAKEENVPCHIIGNGSNLLVSDKGVRGIVIATAEMKEMTVSDTLISASCGVSLARLAGFAKQNALAGLEFASGIPGTVGGGMMMNAGAYGGALSDCAKETLCADFDGNLKTLSGAEQGLSYRKSAFSEQNLVVLETTFALTRGNEREIEEKMKDFNVRRKEKQPLEFPSAGSTFKRPEGYFAGKLIEDAGLKGFRAGGASVSEKHAGFVINDKGGTTADILAVMQHCKDVVYQKFGVVLEPEVRFLGEF